MSLSVIAKVAPRSAKRERAWHVIRIGRLVSIDNKAGAATVIGGDEVAKSPPDGYTLPVSGANSYPIVLALRDKQWLAA